MVCVKHSEQYSVHRGVCHKRPPSPHPTSTLTVLSHLSPPWTLPDAFGVYQGRSKGLRSQIRLWFLESSRPILLKMALRAQKTRRFIFPSPWGASILFRPQLVPLLAHLSSKPLLHPSGRWPSSRQCTAGVERGPGSLLQPPMLRTLCGFLWVQSQATAGIRTQLFTT